MNTRTNCLRLALVLVLLSLFVQPATLDAQCAFNTRTTASGPYMLVYKTFTGGMDYLCTAVAINAADCYPDANMMTVMTLVAGAQTATTMTMEVSCVWNCACGTVTIDGSDGLPVELMEFSVDDNAESEGKGTESDESEVDAG